MWPWVPPADRGGDCSVPTAQHLPATSPPAFAWEHTGPRQPGGPVCMLMHVLPSQDLIKVHRSFLRAIDLSMMAGGGTLAKVFLEYKER